MSPPTRASIQLRVAVSAVLMIGACTTPNPKYCRDDRDCVGLNSACNLTSRRCGPKLDTAVEADAALDASPDMNAERAADALAPDAAADRTPDVSTDAPGTCAMDFQCATGRFCVPPNCVECRTGMDADCKTPGRNICDQTNHCVECRTNAQCAAGKPLCTNGSCQPCLDDSACAGRAGTLACDKAPGMGACVECTADSYCTADSKPICDVAKKTCAPCASDDQCVKKLASPNPGVCLSHLGGRCATPLDAIYVQKSASCVMAGATDAGSLAHPYCLPQQGVDSALATNRRTVVLRGPDPLTEINVAVTGNPLTVVGQMGAAIYPGAREGIRLTAGNLTVRGVTVAGGALPGIKVEGNAILSLNRSILKGNAGGGLVVMGTAGFDVSNTVFDGNGPGSVGLAGFGGAYLGANPTGKFRFNTVVGNMDRGVVCERAGQTLPGVLLYNNLIADQFNCTVSPSNSKVGVDPLFDSTRPYHITMGSPCWNAGGAIDVPPDDIDGDARPPMGASDCGADELK